MDVDARLEALEVENQRLRDELDALKETQGLSFRAPVEWRLTPQETRVFGALLTGGLKTKDSLMARLYRDTAKDEPEIKIVDVFICKLRKKVAPHGMDIRTVWGQGYELTSASIVAFRAQHTPGQSAAFLANLAGQITAEADRSRGA